MLNTIFAPDKSSQLKHNHHYKPDDVQRVSPKLPRKNAYGGVSTTTYLVAVDVHVGGSPLKIRYLETRTCGAKPCE